MKKIISFLAVFLLLLSVPSFALACHPDEHFGFLVAMDEGAKTFTIYHTGGHPEMGGRLFSFSVDADLVKTLKVGTKVAVKFVAEQDQLIAKEIRVFST
jgi:Cu/Ag efflux protein CusF